jgi:hypothetical protein
VSDHRSALGAAQAIAPGRGQVIALPREPGRKSEPPRGIAAMFATLRRLVSIALPAAPQRPLAGIRRRQAALDFPFRHGAASSAGRSDRDCDCVPPAWL